MTAVARRVTVAVLLLLAAGLGTVSGVLFAFADDIPEISALDRYRPNTITRLSSSQGSVIGEFATERRVVVRYEDIAPVLRQAIIATEDGDFEQHFGLSISRILITAFKDVVTGQRAGASTITQQLARNLFLQQEYMRGGVYERSIERKIKEAILAVQLEKRFTKQEIFALYANQVPLHGAYGVEAGARLYFQKSARDLTVDEAATIAAIIQAPARLSPSVNPTRTLARRNNYVLPRMVEEGYITAAQAQAAMKRPVLGTRTADRARASRLFRRARPAGTRGSLRRRRHLRDRPAGRAPRSMRSGNGKPKPRSTAAFGASTSGASATASRRATSGRTAPSHCPFRPRPFAPATSCPPSSRKSPTASRPVRHWSASARGRWSCRAPATRGRGPRRRRSCSRSGTWWRWPSAASRTACPAT